MQLLPVDDAANGFLGAKFKCVRHLCCPRNDSENEGTNDETRAEDVNDASTGSESHNKMDKMVHFVER